VRFLGSGYCNSSRNVALSIVTAFAVALAPAPASAQGAEDSGSSFGEWWSENFEVHGFLTSKIYFRSPNFENDVEMSSWRSEINLESELRLFENDNWRIGLYSVLRQPYDSVYELQPNLWGNGTDRASVGTSPAFPDDVTGIATKSGDGKSFPGAGARLNGEFTVLNSDTSTFFTGEPVPAVAIDDVVFFGRVTAPILPIGRGQNPIGGNATGDTYMDLYDNFPVPNGGFGYGSGLGLEASLAMAGTDPASVATLPGGIRLSTPLNTYAGAIGDRKSFSKGSADVNRNESELKWDCRDNAHPSCFLRELYAELEYKNTFVRIGKQQIVWGKTDAFRLQDKINPIDLSYHNVFPDLEERRIPQWSLDVIHSFGNVGWFEDVSLEFVWVFDRFIPDQFGQCGEPYAFTAACQVRVDAGGHQLFNFALARVDDKKWSLKNTEPGMRLEFRTPDPSIAFSLSAFYTHQDTPVAKFSNFYSVDNPNPAAMLFLQGIFNPTAGAPVAALIEALAGAPAFTTPWTLGFDPYAHDAAGAPVGSLLAANNVLITAWNNIMNFIPAAAGGCSDQFGQDLANCAGAFAVFAMPWTASEATLRYPRIWALGASMDYQIPGIDTVLRVEMAADINRHITNTAKLDMEDESPVFQAAIGIDRSTFIPFLNPNRTAFISLQTFIEHIVDYDEGPHKNSGMVPYETSVISTAFMQNYWRNDSIILTNFVAVDWQASAVIMGPTLRYVHDDHLFFDMGVNVLWGQKRMHNLRDVCSDGSLSCLRGIVRGQVHGQTGRVLVRRDVPVLARIPHHQRGPSA
jgi:hypothetical protein